MLLLCLATAALKLSRPPSLSHAEVNDLVARRTRLRSLRDFAAADAVKESLESAGVRLQDEVSCCVDEYAVPQPCSSHASAVPYVPEAQESLARGATQTCTSLGRATVPHTVAHR